MMLEWQIDDRRFTIRDARSEADFHEVEEIQREAWGFNDLDIVSFALLVASQAAGGCVLCAFEGERMIGFVYGFPSLEHGRMAIHSHMLAVRPDVRNMHAGFYLKMAQRRRALEQGIGEITWTFDPLQSLNAHLNFGKLGVIARRYIINFYGEAASSSPLHQGFGTDRLWVTWVLESERVRRVAERGPQGGETSRPPFDPAGIPFLVRAAGDQPQTAEDFTGVLAAPRLLIEIPPRINELKQQDPGLGLAWRQATRQAFGAAIESGFVVQDFRQLSEPAGTRAYLLERSS